MERSNNPQISVIVPALNEELYIADCLKSLRAQKFKYSFEIIVVDNGSHDRTIEISKQFADRVISESQRGISGTLNTGCREARGEILAFTDADCRVPEYWLSRLFEIFESDKNIVAAGGDYYFYDKKFIPRVIFNKIVVPFVSFSFRLIFFRKYPSLPNSNIAIRRDIYEKAGGYNPNIPWGQENELCSRISKFGKIFFDTNLKVSTSFRRYSREYDNQFIVFFLALKELTITVFRFFPITLLGKGMAPQKPVRKKLEHKISKDVTATKKIALTFDDGPYEKSTEKILDILKEKSVNATFFVLGKYAQKFPEIIRRIFEEKHLIGNHGFSHSRFLFLKSKPSYIGEVKETEEIIHNLTSLRPRFFRPPWGLKPSRIMRAIKMQGYEIISWDIITLDPLIHEKPKRMIERILKKIEPGSIVVFHDGHGIKINYPRENIIQALPEIIDGIRAKGYEIVPLDQLIGEEAYF